MLEFGSKSEKIASALYWITSFFSDQEPLKWELRALASELLSLSVSLRNSLLKEKDAVLLETKNVVTRIIKLISLAKSANLISPENYSILEAELLKSANLLEFPINISDLLSIESPRHSARDLGTLSIKDKTETEAANKRTSFKEFGAVSVKKNNRQSIIINLLKRKKEIMIKDVSPLIEGCSEKTIQRELSSMVRSGLIKRVGDKRWTRYSLV